ncbi:MAG: O-methyltransferase [Lachnospiraceae bacterium]|nr:O-methyltransferase [Lachnospiraceae bacterium]
MIIPERMSAYINSLDTGNGAFLDDLERSAIENHVPVIRPDMQSFLKVLLAIYQPRRILEVGTAVGFSALLMAANTDPACRITTIENYEKRIPLARENFRRAGMEERITLLPGDAKEILPSLRESFDFIFMDAAKGQYIHFLPEVLRLLRVDGVLVSDNVLQDGDIIESHYAIEQRDRTIYKRMREYLYVLKHTEGLLTSIVAVGDGAAVTVKQRETPMMREERSDFCKKREGD